MKNYITHTVHVYMLGKTVCKSATTASNSGVLRAVVTSTFFMLNNETGDGWWDVMVNVETQLLPNLVLQAT